MKVWLAVVVTLLAACGGGTATGSIELVSAETAANRLADDGVVVLDVRTPEEFDAGHLDGAINIDFYAADFRDQLAELDPDASYVMYCRSGNRSAETATIMDELGFSEVDEIEGGILAWDQAGLPIEVP